MAGVSEPPRGKPAPSAFGVWSPLARSQYAAIVWVQGRIFLNSIRTMRGSFELGARILTGFIFFVIAMGPAAGMGFGAYESALHNRRIGLAILLWVLCVVWQFFSALAPALAGQNPDLSYLLRYPVSLGSWIFLYLVYGVVSPSTLIGLVWALGIGLGITVARPDLFLWTATTLGVLVLFNILLSRTILAWVERWMGQRRTREIVTGIFLVLALGAQVMNPAFHHYGKNLQGGISHHEAIHLSHRVWMAQAMLPPGLATEALSGALRHTGGLLPLSGLGLYCVAAGMLLGVRLRSESRGENLSELRREPPAKTRAVVRARPWLDVSGPLAAVVDKDLRYMLRSGPMLYNLAAPLVMVFLFSGVYLSGHGTGFRGQFALPIGIEWAFLGLMRLTSNNLGGEGPGIQFYFLSPTPLRTVMLGKNFMHLLVFLVEAFLITGLVLYRTGAPSLDVAAATIAWILFALPLNFGAGNLLSIFMPYRVNMVRMRRGQGGAGNGMLNLAIQAATVGVGAAVIVPCALLDHLWLATPILLVLAAASLFGYLRVMAKIDGTMQARRETLIAEIAKLPAQ